MTEDVADEVAGARARAAVEQALAEAGATWPAGLWELIGPSEIAHDRTGRVTNLEAVVERLKQAHPDRFTGGLDTKEQLDRIQKDTGIR